MTHFSSLSHASTASGAVSLVFARGFLLGLVLLVAGCSSTQETTNRDRLPRRNPTEAQTPAPVEPPGTTSPSGDGPFLNYADYERQRAGAESDLDLAVGTPRAQSVSECRIIPVGQKACGGPLAYRIYAASGSDELLIIRLAARVSALDGEAIEQFGLSSTCDVTPEPTVVLTGGVCVAR